VYYQTNPELDMKENITNKMAQIKVPTDAYGNDMGLMKRDHEIMWLRSEIKFH
jgi:hypothetical protein